MEQYDDDKPMKPLTRRERIIGWLGLLWLFVWVIGSLIVIVLSVAWLIGHIKWH